MHVSDRSSAARASFIRLGYKKLGGIFKEPASESQGGPGFRAAELGPKKTT